jgi:hypothetical protein
MILASAGWLLVPLWLLLTGAAGGVALVVVSALMLNARHARREREWRRRYVPIPKLQGKNYEEELAKYLAARPQGRALPPAPGKDSR